MIYATRMAFDISAPYDLRMALNKPTIATEEIDAILADPEFDPKLKEQLLLDVVPQGYEQIPG
jgi:hypothetical protein